MDRVSLGLLVLLLTAALVGLSSCSDDGTGTDPNPNPDPPSGIVEGTVTLVPDDSLLAGLQLVLMDAEEMSVVAGPDTTDQAGFFRMERVPVGRFYPIPLYQQDLQFDREPDAVTVLEGEVSTIELRAIRSVLWDAEGLTISGVVREAGSGAPLPGVLLTTSLGGADFFFQGNTLPWETFTDPTGRFELRGVPEICGRVGCTGETWNLMISRAGYRSRSVRFPMPGPGEPDSIHVDLELEIGGDSAVIVGRVVMAGEPVEGVPVALGWFRHGELLDKRDEKAPLMGFASLTDAEGWYRFEGVPSGSYNVSPGYLPDDGYFFWFFTQLHAQFNLMEGERDTIPDLEVSPVVEPIFPARGEVVEVEDPLFRWTGVAEADSYRVAIGGGHLLGSGAITLEPELRLPNPLPDGFFGRWVVQVMKDDQVIGGFEQIHTFEVHLPEAN